MAPSNVSWFESSLATFPKHHIHDNLVLTWSKSSTRCFTFFFRWLLVFFLLLPRITYFPRWKYNLEDTSKTNYNVVFLGDKKIYWCLTCLLPLNKSPDKLNKFYYSFSANTLKYSLNPLLCLRFLRSFQNLGISKLFDIIQHWTYVGLILLWPVAAAVSPSRIGVLRNQHFSCFCTING